MQTLLQLKKLYIFDTHTYTFTGNEYFFSPTLLAATAIAIAVTVFIAATVVCILVTQVCALHSDGPDTMCVHDCCLKSIGSGNETNKHELRDTILPLFTDWFVAAAVAQLSSSGYDGIYTWWQHHAYHYLRHDHG